MASFLVEFRTIIPTSVLEIESFVSSCKQY